VVLPAGPALAQDPVAPTAPGEPAPPPATQPVAPAAGGVPPAWGPFTIDQAAWDTWGGAIQSGDPSQVLRPESIGYTATGVPFSLGILSAADGFGGALAAQPASIVRDLTSQTLLISRLFVDPAVNFGANMAANGAVIFGVDHLGRELQAANGWFLTERGRQYAQYANTLPPGQRNQFLEYIVSNRNRPVNPASPSTLSTRRLDSGRPGTLLQASGLILGGNEFVIPQVDAALSPGLVRDADGRPVPQTDRDWFDYYGPRALNVGLGVAVPFTVEGVRSGRTPRQTALTAGLGFGLPAFQTLLTNAALNPPQDEGLVRTVGVPVAEGLTAVGEGVGGWWEQVDERPEQIVDPWARLDGLAVQTARRCWGR